MCFIKLNTKTVRGHILESQNSISVEVLSYEESYEKKRILEMLFI